MYGTLFVTSGPHGAGKTTLIDELLKDKEIDIERVIPYTTRISHTTKTYLEENQLNDALYLNDYHLDLLTFIETQKNISDTINVTKQKAILMVLEDLAKSRNLPTENHNAPKVLFDNKTLAVMLLSALGFVGIVNNSLKGFNGIVSILRLFTLNPLALYPAGVFFALISATIFFSFDLNQSAKFFGIPFFEHSDVMQNLMEQERLLKSITRSLDKDLIQIKTRAQRERTRTLIHVIQSQLNQLYHYKKQLKKQSEATYIKVIEKLFAAVCGLLFLFNGYFTGQAGAMFLLGASSIAAGMATPLGAFVMISLGIIASIGAFAFYAIVQRRGVESLVRSLMGFNKEQVKSFCNIKKHQQLKAEIDDKEQLLYAFSDNILNKESIEPANQEKKENGIKNTLKRSYSANFFNPYNSKVFPPTNDADFAHKSMNM